MAKKVEGYIKLQIPAGKAVIGSWFLCLIFHANHNLSSLRIG